MDKLYELTMTVDFLYQTKDGLAFQQNLYL